MAPETEAPVQFMDAVGEGAGKFGRLERCAAQAVEEIEYGGPEAPLCRGVGDIAPDVLEVSGRWLLKQFGPTDAGLGAIEQGNGSAGEPELKMLWFVGIDGNVIGLAAGGFGDGVDQGVLRPDAGMVQFGLMTSADHQGLIVCVAEPVPQARRTSGSGTF